MKKCIKILHLAGFMVLAIFLAAAQRNGILLAFRERISDLISASQGVISGYPHWNVYQSRILGPLFVEVVRNLSHRTFQQAYLLSVFLLLTGLFFVLIIIARRLWGSTIAAFGIAIAAWAFNSILMQGTWLYAWDFMDLIIFTLLCWAIITNKPAWIIGSILAFEIFNREVVIILSIWFLIDAIFQPKISEGRFLRPEVKIRYGQFFIALIILGFGYAIINLLRAHLLIKEVGPEIFSDRLTGHFINIHLFRNFQNLKLTFVHPLQNFYFMFNIFIFAIPILALRARLCKHPGLIRASFLYLMLWATTVIFGLMYEARVWLSFVPFLVLVVPMSLANHEPRHL